ncbi:MAG: hypothetical protein FWB72_05175 [Firmicutes bacterium]|nr:hypothetical protein [Bacillota bacterium]
MEKVNVEKTKVNEAPSKKANSANGNIMLPKHRFDAVNLCLKDTRATLAEKEIELGEANARIAELEKTLLKCKVEIYLSVTDTKSISLLTKTIDKLIRKRRR